MPLYEYRCHDCGEFDVLRSLSEYNLPMSCPECDRVAIKIFSVPNINLNSGSFSSIAKKNSGEPRLVKQEQREAPKPRPQSPTSSRPWMISHAPPRY